MEQKQYIEKLLANAPKNMQQHSIDLTVEYAKKQVLSKNKDIVIYGAGNMGLRLCKLLVSLTDRIVCFLDRDAKPNQLYNDLPVYKPDSKELSSQFRESAVVLISIFLPIDGAKAIKQSLMNLGYSDVVFSYDLFMGIYGFCEPIDMNESKEQIMKAYSLLSDEHSHEIFYRFLRAYIEGNYDEFKISNDLVVYFTVDIKFSKGYAHFVDCGAYNGDTLEKLLELHKCSSYVGLEPDRKNFQSLSKKADSLHDKIESTYLYPCALSSECAYLRFNSSGNEASYLGDDGSEIIQAVALDDVLKTDKITMIKMDIEGAEIAALNGAKRIITELNPDLAICVYHKISDLWQIILLLHKVVPEYKFYLRSHGEATIETVLYATVE